MDPSVVRPLLRAVRRLRAGSLDLQEVSTEVAVALRGNLAGACRALALWADASVGDPRAADAFTRTYGLGRMPETRVTIGRSLRSATGRRGISPAAVDDLVRATEAQLAQQVDGVTFPGAWGAPTPLVWTDPFPGAVTSVHERRHLRQVLPTAWADVPDEPVHECGAALLLYEEEHGLRRSSSVPRHRELRRRLRRLAWSMLTVARERHVGRQPDDVIVDLLLGPRRMAVVERLPPEAAVALLAPGPRSPGSIEVALEYVRGAVRHGRPEAPELLALLREAIARDSYPARPSFVIAGVAALTTIVAREQRQAAGVMAASVVVTLATEAGDLLGRLPARDTEQRRRHTRTLTDGLRAAQELAELQDVLGDTAGARRALRSMSGLMRHLDLEDGEVDGWLQQHLQTRSTVARHACVGRRADGWLRLADWHAHQSLDLAEAASLPAGFRLVPASQLLAAAVTDLRLNGRASGGGRSSLEGRARDHLARAEALARAVDGTVDRPTHSARLSVARRRWELALLCRDPDELIAARSAALELVVPCTLPHDLLKLARLEALSRSEGIPAEDVPTVPDPPRASPTPLLPAPAAPPTDARPPAPSAPGALGLRPLAPGSGGLAHPPRGRAPRRRRS